MMAALGLRFVRIGEFAWSRLEPAPGELHFEWLDAAVDVLAAAGLEIIIGTPTATPPKWLVDRYPEILPVDPRTGRVRGFGSRRHYDFSSARYLAEALRITEHLVRRYGSHDAVVGWQTDNELCCHDTAHSGSAVARSAFQEWCRQRYGTVQALNEAWGNVFWSMEYRDFAEIELPVGAVTETGPAHRLDYCRFSSDRVVGFHDAMVELLRRHAPGKFVTHNFIPMADTKIDNFALAAPLDFASYDSYPLGRTDVQFGDGPLEEFRRYMRTGHPDLTAYSLDQTRGLGNNGFWVMEQQPGPVNWARNNPRPADGMVRFWTLEAFAHGADCVSYFRWRQVPFAQEQMHAGLLRPDSSKSRVWSEIEQVIAEAKRFELGNHPRPAAPVAIVTAAESAWVCDIERQGDAFDFEAVQFAWYTALRAIGVSVDFVPVNADLSRYSLVLAPCLPIVDDAFAERCRQSGAKFVFGPRSGAKTAEFRIPPTLAPGALQRLVPVRVLSVETLRADCEEVMLWEGKRYASRIWREELDSGDASVVASFDDGAPAVVRNERYCYIATLTEQAFLRDFLRSECRQAGIETFELGADLRLQRRGNLLFAFNYSKEPQALPLPDGAELLIGETTLGPYGVAVCRT